MITDESPFQSYMNYLPIHRTDLQTLISSLTETIDIMDKHYKCYESCSILTAEADEIHEKLISYEDILTSDSIIDYKLSTIQDDLNKISVQINSLDEKFQQQEFLTEVNPIELKASIESVIRPLHDQIEELQRLLTLPKIHLENKCEEAIYEYRNVIVWIELVTIDMKDHHPPKFKDYFQPELRKRNDYTSMVKLCKSEIEKSHSEYNIKKGSSQTKEQFSKSKSYQRKLEIFGYVLMILFRCW